ncbi:MAG: TIGR04255 family protein [Acidimicrobiales bacterium]
MSNQGDHPVYPNPSATHVVLEVQFPSTATDPATAEAGLRAGLRDQFPLGERLAQSMVTIDLGNAASAVEQITMLRYQSRDRTRTVAVTPNAVTIETTEYLGFDWYCEFLRQPLDVLAEVLQPDGIVGMGHRFIDEIRVPGGAPADWSEWIDPLLLAPSRVPAAAGLDAPASWRGSVEYRTSDETTLTLRYGPSDGPVVLGTPASRTPVPQGPCFLLDWDSRLRPSTAPEFTAEGAIEQCVRLYKPVRAIYHHLTIDKLRSVFAADPEGTP